MASTQKFVKYWDWLSFVLYINKAVVIAIVISDIINWFLVESKQKLIKQNIINNEKAKIFVFFMPITWGIVLSWIESYFKSLISNGKV